MSVSTAPQQRTHERTFFGQPRVLANLVGVEMWERFSGGRGSGGGLLLAIARPVRRLMHGVR